MTRWLTHLLMAGLLAAPHPALAGPGDSDHPIARIEDFEVLEGDDWSGSLTYLNYNSEERSTIPVKLQVREVKGRTMNYAIQYPGEEEYNSKEQIVLSRDGRRIDGFEVVARIESPDGALLITTLGKGEDDERPADLQFVYTLSADRLSIRKDVRFEGDEAFFNRNEYAFER